MTTLFYERVFLFLLGMGALFACSTNPKTSLVAEPKPAGAFANCPGQSARVEWTTDFQLSLDETTWTHASKKAGGLEKAVFESYKYVKGYFMNEALPDGTKILPIEGEIEILKLRKVSRSESAAGQIDYPDSFLKGASLARPEIHYLKHRVASNAAKKRNTLNFEVSIRFGSMACTPKPNQSVPTQLNVTLPKDPYLAYWDVPEEDRRPIRFNKALVRGNPCSEHEYPDVSDPSYYWYFWSPNRVGTDDNGETFDCRTLSSFRKRTQTVQLMAVAPDKLRKPTAWTPTLPTRSQYKEIAIVFGYVNYQQSMPSYEEVKNAIEETWSQGVKPSGVWEAGVRNLLNTIVEINETYRLTERARFTPVGKSVWVEWTMISRATREPTHVRMFYGPTDYLGISPPEHEKFIHQIASKAELLIYSGHSGLGLNIKVKSWFASVTNRKTPIDVALLSCVASAYYSDQLLTETFSILPKESRLVLTGSSNLGTHRVIPGLVVGNWQVLESPNANMLFSVFKSASPARQPASL